MSSSIVLAGAGWVAPDGTSVLTDVSLSFTRERTGLVGRNGVGKTTLLKLASGELQPSSGNVTVNGTIATLQQRVQVGREQTISDLLGVTDSLAALRKAEAGTATLDELAHADWTLEPRAAEALAKVGLNMPLETPLIKLSGGQRTRASLAGAIFAAPDFLLLDEPTNDLDRDGRQAVHDLLQGWRSGAIVVSHDRELLELMDSIVELSSLGATRYGGNWSEYRARKEVERAAAQQDLASATRQLEQIARKKQVAVERKQRRDKAGARKAARGDMPRILAGTLRDRAEKSGGEETRMAERLRNDAAEAAEEARACVERTEAMSLSIASTGLPSSRRVLELDSVSFGYASGPLLLEDASLTVVGPERIAVTGANASGKSTLLSLISGRLGPLSGSLRVHVPFAFFDQRVSILDAEQTIAENFQRLNPDTNNNTCRAVLARFVFRAEAADQRVGTLSGGQLLRAGLACVLGAPSPPPLLMLDEPTNHLDLDSIGAVEAALTAFDGALIVVSHDEPFLNAIGIGRRNSVGDGRIRDDTVSRPDWKMRRTSK